MARIRPPAARGFTVAEKRSITFERVSLYMVALVAIIAAVISFQALTWVGTEMGLAWAAPLIPVAVDGFAVACSVGVVRSQASGERLRERFSEWLGIYLALALSIAGNVTHALHIGTGLIPVELTASVAGAIPLIVAYGIHVYGRAMVRGISAHVLADDPDQLHFGLVHLGDDDAQGRHAAPRKPAAQPARETAPAARTTPAQPARETAPAARALDGDSLKGRARTEFDRMVSADPTTKPDAAAIHATIESPKNPATTRRWVQAWWEEHEEALGVARPDPILEQLATVPDPAAARTA